MSCQECIERCYPSDPREFGSVNGVYPLSGRYHRPVCDTCPNKNEVPPTSFEIPLPCTECPTHKQFLRLRGELEHLKTKVTELRAKKKQGDIRF